MKAYELFVQCLESEGVEVIFGTPGAENLDLLQGISDSGIRFVTARSECGAAFMADAYARVTGRAGVCLTAAGVSSTNLVTGLAVANKDHSPVVAITGQRNLARIQRESYQGVDIVSALKPVTKWSKQIVRPELVPDTVHKAFRIAQTEAMGACHLDFPEDVATLESAGKPLGPANLRRPAPPDRILDGAAELIDEASRVVVLAGHGSVRGESSGELVTFVEELGIPLVCTSNAKGILPADHPNFLYTIDVQGEAESLQPLKEAEVVLAIGFELDELPPDLWNEDRHCQIVHMSASPPEINRNYSVAVEVIGDIRDSLRNLKMMIRKPKKLENEYPFRSKISSLMGRAREDTSFPFSLPRLVADLGDTLKAGDLMLCDMGTHRFWISQLFPAPSPGSVIMCQSLHATGFALPGAVGAQIADPERRVVAVCGDGGFLAGCADLVTIKSLQLPICVLILNNGRLGYVRSLQLKRFGHSVATEIDNPDFVAMAKAFGIDAFRIEQGQRPGEKISEAIERRKPTVIEIPVDSSE